VPEPEAAPCVDILMMPRAGPSVCPAVGLLIISQGAVKEGGGKGKRQRTHRPEPGSGHGYPRRPHPPRDTMGGLKATGAPWRGRGRPRPPATPRQAGGRAARKPREGKRGGGGEGEEGGSSGGPCTPWARPQVRSHGRDQGETRREAALHEDILMMPGDRAPLGPAIGRLLFP
jgi:hypothetical protein